MKPTLFFIVPAYNEEKFIAGTLLAIRGAAGYFNYRILVVDDGSTDNTRSEAQKMAVEVSTKEFRHLGKIRNYGAKTGRQDIFVFVDADTVITRAVLEEMVQAHSEGYRAGCAYGNFYDIKDEPKINQRLMDLYTWFVRRVWKVGFGFFIWVEADAFKKVGGFPEDLYLLEDVQLCRNIKSRFGRDKFYQGINKVQTSGRKVRTHNFLWVLLKLIILYYTVGRRAFKTRKHLGVWYDGKR